MRRGIARLAAVAGMAAAMALTPAVPAGAEETVGLVNPDSGEWIIRNEAFLDRFFFGNPGDFPIYGDWDCDGIDSPGMYRRADGFVYLSNANRSQVADIRFFFGNPGDLPLAGDFDGDGCDTVSIYRPSEGRFYIINELGANEGGLGAADVDYLFGDVGDKPFVGDFDGDGVETVGLHRESTGLVYFRQTHTQGAADSQFIFGDPGDRLASGDWNGDGIDTPALFRPIEGQGQLYPGEMFFRFTNTQGIADALFCFTFGWPQGIPIAGDIGKNDPFQLLGPCRIPPPPTTFGNGIHQVAAIGAGLYRMLSDGSSCYWARLSGFGGQLDDIIANEFSREVEVVRILPTDAGFESDGCNQWSSDVSPRRPDPTAPWVSDGVLFVHQEIAAGTWRNAPTDSCYWERLSDFTGELGDIITNSFSDSPSIVTIESTDAGFSAHRDCGTWTKIG